MVLLLGVRGHDRPEARARWRCVELRLGARSTSRRAGIRNCPRLQNSDKSYYDPMGLPGENHDRFTEPEWLRTPAIRRLKQLLRHLGEGPAG